MLKKLARVIVDKTSAGRLTGTWSIFFLQLNSGLPGFLLKILLKELGRKTEKKE